MVSEWVSVYTRCSQYKLTKTKANPIQANTFDHPAPRQMRKTFFAAGDQLRCKACVTESAVDRCTAANRAADGEQILQLRLFYLCWLFPVWECECVFVCLYIDVRYIMCVRVTWMNSWTKTCLSRFKLSMDLTVVRHKMKKTTTTQKQRKGLLTGAWRVAFWHRERLSWFVQRRRFVTVLILW